MKQYRLSVLPGFIAVVITLTAFMISTAVWQTGTAQAQGLSFPAQMNKSFTPIAIPMGGVSTLNVTIYNSNSFALTLSSTPPAWTDTLPAGMVFANILNAKTTCGGTVTTAGNKLSLIGGTVPAKISGTPGSCKVEVDVTSTTSGNLINVIDPNTLIAKDPTGTIDITNSTEARATLQVNTVQPPSLSKSFASNTIYVGQTSVLTLKINNTDTNTDLTEVAITDNLPTNITVASAPSPSQCGGTVTYTPTSVTLNGGKVLKQVGTTPGSCSILVTVKSVIAGVYTNLIPANAIQTRQGVTNASAASAPLNVQAIRLTKSFSPANIKESGTSTLTILLQNPGASSYTNVSLTDTLPAGLTIANPPNASTTCNDLAHVPPYSATLTAAAGTRNISITNGAIPTGTCNITVNVTSSIPASYTNNIPVNALVTNEGATNIIAANANLFVYRSGLGISSSSSKNFKNPITNNNYISVGGTAVLSINIIAPADEDLTGFALTDALPTGVRVAASPAPTKNGNCGGLVFTPTAGDTLLTASGGSITKGATCTITVQVTSDTPGTFTNVISAANISNDQNQTIGASLTADLIVSGLTVAKSFSPTTINPDGISTLSIKLSNSNPNQLDNVSLLSDTLPGTTLQGLVIADPPNANTTCTGGTVIAVKNTQIISMTNGIIPANVLGVDGICTINVDVIGKGSAVTRRNTIYTGAVTGTVHGTSTIVSNRTDAYADLVIKGITVAVVKGFNPQEVTGGSSSTLSIQLSNPNNVALTGISLVDHFPQTLNGEGARIGGITVANPSNLSIGTCGGTLIAPPGAQTITYSGGYLASSASCTLSLSMTMNVNANLTNTIQVGEVTTSNGAKNTQATSASLTNLPGANVRKAFSPNTTLAGNSSTLTITIENTSNFQLDGMGLIDDLPAGLVIADSPVPVNNCGGSLEAVAGTGHIHLTEGVMGGIVAEGDPAVTCTLVVSVTGPAAGAYPNCIVKNTLTNNQNATNIADACDTLTLTAPVLPPTITKAFSPTSIPVGGTSALTFTITNPSANGVALTGVAFTDTFPAGLTIASVPNVVQCGGTVSSTANSITLTNGSIAKSGNCTVTVSVTSAEGASYVNLSEPVTSTNGGTGGTATATLTVIAPPSISKAFDPTPDPENGFYVLTFTLTNPNTATILTGVSFTDTLPSGMKVASTPGGSTLGCNASSTPVFAPASSDTILSFNTGSIAPNGTCTVKVNVTASGGSYANLSGAVTSANGGTGNKASDTLNVLGPGLSLVKAKTSIRTGFQAANDLIDYSYTLKNTGDVTLTGNGLGGIFTVSDNKTTVTCPPASTSLAPGETLVCTATYTVQPADVTNKSVTNTATATAKDPSDQLVTSNPSSVTVPLESLTLKKTTATSGYQAAGNTINYTYTLTNTGIVTLTGADASGKFTITDDHFPSSPGTPFTCGTATSLAPGANVSCSAIYTVKAADVTAGSVTNLAVGGAKDPVDQSVNSNTSSVTVNLVVPPTITKAFDPNPVAVGATSILTFTITNPPSNTVPLTGVNFSDTFPLGLTLVMDPDAAQCGGLVTKTVTTTTTVSLSGGTVIPGSSCTVTVSVTSAARGSYPNVSGKVGSTSGGINNDPITGKATATLDVISPPTITKTFSPTSISVGETSSIIFTISNPNPSTEVKGVAFTDSFPAGMRVAEPPGASTPGCNASGTPAFTPAAGDTSLAFSGGSIAGGGTCTVQVDVTAARGSYNNTTNSVTSTNGGTGATSNTATLMVNDPALSLKKSIASGNPYNAVDGKLGYHYLLTNTGNVTLIGNGTGGLFTVTDDKTTVTCSPTPTGLAPGESVACTSTYSVTQADLDHASVTNQATGHGLFGSKPVDTNLDTVTAEGTQTPGLTLIKNITSGNPYNLLNGTIQYSYLLRNSGNVTLRGKGLGGIFTVTDDKAIVTCPDTPTSLASGETVTCSASYSVTQADLDSGSVTNLATAHALFGSTDVDSTQGTQTANASQGPALTLAKSITSGDSYSKVGDIVEYGYKLTNSGNVTLTGVSTEGLFTIQDDHIGDPLNTAFTCGSATVLIPGAEVTCTAAYTVTQADLDSGSVTNRATGHAQFKGTPVASDPSSQTATATQSPALTLAKSITSGDPYAKVGDKVNYDYLLTNSGNVTLTGSGTAGVFMVTDDKVTVTCPAATTSLAPTAQVTCTAVYSITQADLDSGSITNQATGHAQFKGTPVASDPSSQTATATQSPALTLEKTITSGDPYANVGDVINYSYTLTNSGNVTLNGDSPTSLFTITDDHIGTPFDTPFTCGTAAILAPKEKVTCASVYTITQEDLDHGAVTNQANGHGLFGTTPVLSNQASQTATATQTPDLTLKKSVKSGDLYTRVGDVVTYSYTLTNSGNVTLAGNNAEGLFTITDDHIGTPIETPFTCDTVLSLAPTAAITCTADYTITQDDMDRQSVTNQAKGHALFDAAPVTSNQASATTNIKRGAITGIVFNDINLSLAQDPKELGIGNVTIRIYKAAGAEFIATTKTGPDGSFSVLDLLPGTYYAVEEDLFGFVSSTPNSVSAAVLPGETAHTIFGDYKISGSATNTISGTVFEDANSTGVRETKELAIQNVTITLYDQNNRVVATATTLVKGTYSFTRLPPGIYTVVETNPSGYVSTTLDHVGVALSSGTHAVVNFGDLKSGVAFIDPAVTKFVNPRSARVGDTVVYIITVGNNGSADALNVVLTDTKPAFLDIIDINIAPNKFIPVNISENKFTINFGTVRPTDFYTVTVVTQVNALGLPPGGDNLVSLQTDSVPDPVFNNNSAAHLSIPGSAEDGILPLTGFTPNQVSAVPAMPENAYDTYSDLTIEIPAIGLNTAIVGIPMSGKTWDVSWLGSQVGYLDGTAFPSLPGNSVITGHVYGANGLPGPLVNLGNLKWGDPVIIRAFGQKFTYAVRSVYHTDPKDTSAFGHKDQSWVTLVTCRQFDAKTNTYLLRTIVQAVLVQVENTANKDDR